MKFLTALCALLALILTPAAVPAEFFVIPGGGPPMKTEIKSLPYTISSPGYYYITQDLACTAESHAVTISTDDVTLNLMGFSLIGQTTGAYNGVYMYNRKNVEIRNGSVRNFLGSGILGSGSESIGNRVINVRVHDSTYYGINLLGQSNLVQGCTSYSNGLTGIRLNVDCTAVNNVTYNNTGSGIDIDNGSKAMGNTCYHNGAEGIAGSLGASVLSNTVYDNTGTGIAVSTGSQVKDNVCYANGAGGILTGASSQVAHNVCNMNTGGDQIAYCVGCSFVENIPTTIPPP